MSTVSAFDGECDSSYYLLAINHANFSTCRRCFYLNFPLRSLLITKKDIGVNMKENSFPGFKEINYF